MLKKPATVHTKNSTNPIFSNRKRFRRNGIFRIRIRKIIAPPTIHVTALFGVERILKNPNVHERFERITAIFETINVTKVSVLTAFLGISHFKSNKINKQTNNQVFQYPAYNLIIFFLHQRMVH